MKKEQNVRVAIAQLAPRMFDTPACVGKACSAIREAGGNGAKIILFPEAYIGGYPKGMTFATSVGFRNPEGRKAFRLYYESAITVPGPETDALGEAAAAVGAYVVIGVIEREEDTSTLYCTAVFIGPNGKVLGKHRKLRPSGCERLIWGMGDGSTLPVIDTPYGKIGAVICRENSMPLLRTAMYAKGVRIYLAPTLDHRPGWQCSLRHIALEGRCFVLACNQYMQKSDYPDEFPCKDELSDKPDVLLKGGSAIASPMGEYIVEPIWEKEEIAYADLDLGAIEEARYDFDVVGHYNRPDVFQLYVNEEKQQGFIFSGADPYDPRCCDAFETEDEE
jgi:nitrilase